MMIVPPDVASFAAYVVPNRSTSPPVAPDADGSAEAGWLASALGAVLDAVLGAVVGAVVGAGVVLVPPQAATRIVAPANRPTSFRIKAPPGCVWGPGPVVRGSSMAATRAGSYAGAIDAVHRYWRRHARTATTWAALGRGSLTVLRVSNRRQGPGRE